MERPLRPPPTPRDFPLDQTPGGTGVQSSGVRERISGFTPGGWIGRFALEARIGRGGMAEVWRALPADGGAPVALKRMLSRMAESATSKAMFLREASIGVRVRHPNLVRVLEVGELEQSPFFVMELVDGPSCAGVLRRALAERRRLSPAFAVHVTLELLRALEHLHHDLAGGGVVHRDVSPGNVLVARGGVVKLADYGIAVRADRAEPSLPAQLHGKRGYMAPEQIANSQVDVRVDLFAAGVVLVELCTAQPLFASADELELLMRNYEAVASLSRAIPERIRALAQRVLAQSPLDRPRSAADFARELGEATKADGIEPTAVEIDRTLDRLGFDPSRAGGEPSHPRWRLEASSRDSSSPRSLPPSTAPFTLSRIERISAAAAAVATGAPHPVVLTAGEQALLGRLTQLAAYRFEHQPGVAWRRPLARGSLPAVLFRLALERATGLLVARHQGAQKRVYFRDGSPFVIASTDPNELFGVHLIRAGHANAEQVQRCLEHALRHGMHLGEAMVDLERLAPILVIRALRAQLHARFQELATWREGELCFSPGANAGVRGLRLHDPPERLVASSIRAGYTDEEISAMLEPIAPEPLHRAAHVDPERFGLTLGERAVLLSWRAGESLKRALDRVGEAFQPMDVRRVVSVGLAAGWLAPPKVVFG